MTLTGQDSDTTKEEAVGQRIAGAMDDAFLKPQEMASRLDVSERTVRRWTSEGFKGKRSQLEAIAEMTNVRQEWLLTGEGPRRAEVEEKKEDLDYDPRNGFDLTIYHSVRPAAGEGNIVYMADEHDAETHKQSKRIFKDLLGFWPPDDMRGMYVDGESMKPGLRDKLLVLYRPVQQMYSGQRYILQVEDPHTGDLGLRVKRVVTHAGGGVRIISDNKGLGVPDEELIPNGDNQLVNQATGRTVRLHVIGQVLWPSERDREDDVRLITQTIEQLAGEGMLKQ